MPGKTAKKVIMPIITAIFIFLSCLPVYAAASDIKGHWAEKEIQGWKEPDAYLKDTLHY